MVTAKLTTVDDLAAMPEDDNRYDLIEGELRRMSPTGFVHLQVVGTVTRVVGTFAFEHDLGIVGGEGGFVLQRDPDTVLAPDVAFVRKERLPPVEEREGFAQLAPDLAVEVLSPHDTSTAIEEKVNAYLAGGVRLVWVLNPRRRTAWVRGADGTDRMLTADEELDGGDVLPGFRVRVGTLFE